MRVDLNGTWHNQHGSEMVLETAPNGTVQGIFRSGTGLAKLDDECRLSGFVAGDLVTFSVDFGKFGSLTAWTGHVIQERGNDLIHAVWHMTIATPTPASSNEWKGVWTGSDVFQRGPAPSRDAEQATLPSHPVPLWP